MSYLHVLYEPQSCSWCEQKIQVHLHDVNVFSNAVKGAKSKCYFSESKEERTEKYIKNCKINVDPVMFFALYLLLCCSDDLNCWLILNLSKNPFFRIKKATSAIVACGLSVCDVQTLQSQMDIYR